MEAGETESVELSSGQSSLGLRGSDEEPIATSQTGEALSETYADEKADRNNRNDEDQIASTPSAEALLDDAQDEGGDHNQQIDADQTEAALSAVVLDEQAHSSDEHDESCQSPFMSLQDDQNPLQSLSSGIIPRTPDPQPQAPTNNNNDGDKDAYNPNNDRNVDAYNRNNDGDKDANNPNNDRDLVANNPNNDGDKDANNPSIDGDKDVNNPNSDGDKDANNPNNDGDKDANNPNNDTDKKSDNPEDIKIEEVCEIPMERPSKEGITHKSLHSEDHERKSAPKSQERIKKHKRRSRASPAQVCVKWCTHIIDEKQSKKLRRP